jgi:hypothetical protein
MFFSVFHPLFLILLNLVPSLSIMRLLFLKPRPQPPLKRNEELIPEYTANIFDKISFGWIYPLLKVSRNIDALWS